MKKQFSLSGGLSGKGFLIIGLIIGVSVTAALMLLSAAALLFLNADRALAVPLSTVCAAAGAFAAAFYNAWHIGDKGYKVGLLTGGAAFLAVLLVSFLIADGNISLNTLFHFIIMLLAGAIGGIMGVNRKQSKKYF